MPRLLKLPAERRDAARADAPAALLSVVIGAVWAGAWVANHGAGDFGARAGGILTLLAVALAALVGLLLSRSGGTRLGALGLWLALGGAVTIVATVVIVKTFGGSTGEASPIVGWLAFLAPVTLMLGWSVFGLDALISRSLPRWSFVPLLIAILFVGTSTIYDELHRSDLLWRWGMSAVGLGFILLGYALWPVSATGERR